MSERASIEALSADSIPSLLPRGAGHWFVLYGDGCSGVPGARHEQIFAAVNAVARRLEPPPEFIVFPGDEVVGLTADLDALRAQWRHWLDHETAWPERRSVGHGVGDGDDAPFLGAGLAVSFTAPLAAPDGTVRTR